MKKEEKIAPRVFLPRFLAWVFIIILVYLDAILDIVVGKGMGNPLWVPFIEKFGSYIVLILPIPLFAVFFFFIKILSFIVVKVDKLPYAEEVLLTALVVVYSLFDIWLISIDFLGFTLINNFKYVIPFLIAGGLIYALWAEKKIRKG